MTSGSLGLLRLLWSRRALLAGFFTRQGLVQLLAALASLAVLRILPQAEYAIYALFTSFLTTINTLSDSGVSSALTALSARHLADSEKVRLLVRVGLGNRALLALGASVFLMPLLWFQLNRLAVDWRTASIVTSLLLGQLAILAVVAAWVVVLRLKDRVRAVQQGEAAQNGAKLALSLSALSSFPVAIVAAAISVVSSAAWLGYTLHQRPEGFTGGIVAPKSREFRQRAQAEVRRVVRALLPLHLFFVVQGQLPLWILGVVGGVEGVAGLGGLTRVGLVFSILSPILPNIAGPRFALLEDPSSMRRFALRTCLLSLLAGLAIIALGASFSGAVLFVLGESYKGYNLELVLILISGALGLLTGSVNALLAARAWVSGVWRVIPLAAAVIALAVLVLDVATVRGAILLGIAGNLPYLVVYAIRLRQGLAAESRAGLESGGQA